MIATDHDAIVGSWMSAGWRFRFDIIREGGHFLGLFAEGLENGELDAANPNSSLRTRTILGINLFEGLRFVDGVWKGGRMYNPENGGSYALRLRLLDSDRLEMRAYIGHPAIGLSQIWERRRDRPDFRPEAIAAEAGLSPAEVWTAGRARSWFAAQSWPVGCDYIPATAINQLEMWQKATFNPAAIRRELELAKGLGFNTLRVYLHDLLWRADPVGFRARISRFLDIAGGLGFAVLFVLFDDCWNDQPRLGRQKRPRPSVHNSGWVRGPGTAAIDDEAEWPRLADYTGGVVGAFARDERVFGWDLYNEIGNSVGFRPNSTRLLGRVFKWARQAAPSQPLTAGVWKTASWFRDLNRFLIDFSDIVSFHDYSPADNLARRIDELAASGKPLLCTEYLARVQGSRFQTHLPLFKARGVGALNWGLVAGKTQTIYPWGSRRGAKEPAVWFHDIFRDDGTAWDPEEIKAIRAVTAV